jgi:hypothetical protein
MTLTATVARRRHTPGHLLKSLEMGKTTHFQTLVFPEKIFPQYNGGYQSWAQSKSF